MGAIPDGTGGFLSLETGDFPPFEKGWVWLVGAGPGAPGLLTLLGYHALRSADVVVYDALVNEGLFRWLGEGARVECAGKRGGKPSALQNDISERLVMLARRGERVLRLKGGDPFMFGRGGEECEFLSRAGIPFRVVPGVSAGLGGLAYAGIAVTHRRVNQSVVFVTGHDVAGGVPAAVDWDVLARSSPVLVMYMVVRNLRIVAKRLMKGGRDPGTPVAIVSWASLPWQSIARTNLGDIAKGVERVEDLPKPAVVVVGEVVDLHPLLNWYGDELRNNTIG